MSTLSTTRLELQRYFQEWIDTAFQNDFISRHTRDAMLRGLSTHIPSLVQNLNNTGKARLGRGKQALRIFIREGKDPSHGSFCWFEIARPSKRRRRLRCFLGHRFRKDISDCLRMNLRHVLEPSNIHLVWSGMDMGAAGFFDHIVLLIKSCDFCIFDNRMTSEKPNVYIEAGIAYALKRPFILANYQANRIGVPSDLVHLLNIPYRNYKELTKKALL